MKPNVRIEQYQEAADTVSIGGIRWLTKYDVKVKFSDRDTALAWKDRIEQMLQGQTEREPLTDVQKIAEALRRHELTLIRTATGYDVLSLNQLDAHSIKEQQ